MFIQILLAKLIKQKKVNSVFTKLAILCFLVCFSTYCFSQENIKSVVKTESTQENIEDTIKSVKLQLSKATQNQEKLALYEKLAVLSEFSGLYPEAVDSYQKASKLATSDSESYVFKAVRCALSSGDTVKADSLLSSISEKTRNTENASKLKLYALWSWLSKCDTYDDTFEPVTILKSYVDMPTMSTQKSSILYTLWYVTQDNVYADRIKSECKNSSEYSIIMGDAQLMPSPFWYFIPKNTNTEKSTTVEKNKTTNVTENSSVLANKEVAESVDKVSSKAGKESVSESSNVEITLNSKEVASSDEITKETKTTLLYYQLGFFSSYENAKRLVDRVLAKNIKAEIIQEKRESGNTYYAVIVKNDSSSDIGDVIRNNGFECCPVFK